MRADRVFARERVPVAAGAGAEVLLLLLLDQADKRNRDVAVIGDQVGQSVEALVDREGVDVVLREGLEAFVLVLRREDADLRAVVDHVVDDEPQSIVGVRQGAVEVFDDQILDGFGVDVARRNVGKEDTGSLWSLGSERADDVDPVPSARS